MLSFVLIVGNVGNSREIFIHSREALELFSTPAYNALRVYKKSLIEVLYKWPPALESSLESLMRKNKEYKIPRAFLILIGFKFENFSKHDISVSFGLYDSG